MMTRIKYPILLIGIFLLSSNLINAQDAINWVSLEEAQELNKKEPRKIMIDLYTDWCGWCKRMDATTFKDPKVVEYVNKNYYAVKLNAETKDTIVFNGHSFVNRTPDAKRSNHEIASIGAREDGRLGFPTIVYLDENLQRISVIPGYQSAENIQAILAYFADGHYKTTPWDEFLASYNGAKAPVEEPVAE